MARMLLRSVVAATVVVLLFPGPRHMIVPFVTHTLMLVVFGIIGGLVMLSVSSLGRGRRRR